MSRRYLDLISLPFTDGISSARLEAVAKGGLTAKMPTRAGLRPPQRRDALAEVAFDELGPAIGERFSDILLAGADGAPVDLHADRAGRPALVVFYRRARW